MRSPTALLSLSILNLVLAEIVPDSSCNCFLTNGTEPTYYANHIFFDFRNLSQYAAVPDVISTIDDTPTAPPTSDYFKSDTWTKTWELQTWNNSGGDATKSPFTGDATVLMINSPNNVYIDKNNESSGTYMTMRTKRLAKFQTASEFQTQSSGYRFLSLRMLARTVGSPGAVSAFFTYRSAKSLADIQEADMEILTRGPRNRVQYTNQPSYTENGGSKPDATRNASLPGGLAWSDWAVYRLDWTPKTSIWYVDGEEVANIAFQVPRDAAGINFNSWGDGGSWSGNMSVGGEASLQIQWIEMVYNTTDNNGAAHVKRRSEGDEFPSSSLSGPSAAGAKMLLPRDGKDKLCGAVCSIDESLEKGAVAKLWGDKSSSVRMSVSLCTVVVMIGLCLALG